VDLSSDEEGHVAEGAALASSPKRSRLLASVLQTPPGTPVAMPFVNFSNGNDNDQWSSAVLQVSEFALSLTLPV